MSSWTPIGGTLPTFKEACENFVMWTRPNGAGKEAIRLPGRIVEKLGFIPHPEIAWVIIMRWEDAHAN